MIGDNRAARYLRKFHPWYVDRLPAMMLTLDAGVPGIEGIDTRGGHVHADEFEVAVMDCLADGRAHADGDSPVGKRRELEVEFTSRPRGGRRDID